MNMERVQRYIQWRLMSNGQMYLSMESVSGAPLLFFTCKLSIYIQAPTCARRLQRP